MLFVRDFTVSWYLPAWNAASPRRYAASDSSLPSPELSRYLS